MKAHGDYLVDIVDHEGAAIAQKARKDVDKSRDLYHGVFVLILTPHNEVVLSQIPERRDLPNRYANKLGLSVATIRRHGETTQEAAHRALTTEVSVDSAELRHLGDSFTTLSDGQPAYISAFYVVQNTPENYSRQDIGGFVAVPINQLDTRLIADADAFAPTLTYVWQTYHRRLLAKIAEL